eukprot:7160432-Prymnesium_polylepis.1
MSNARSGIRLNPAASVGGASSGHHLHCSVPRSRSEPIATTIEKETPNLRPRSVMEPLACALGGSHVTAHSDSSGP